METTRAPADVGQGRNCLYAEGKEEPPVQPGFHSKIKRLSRTRPPSMTVVRMNNNRLPSTQPVWDSKCFSNASPFVFTVTLEAFQQAKSVLFLPL